MKVFITGMFFYYIPKYYDERFRNVRNEIVSDCFIIL